MQDFQPEYLRARRKSKPQIAKRIVQIVRRKGGRFLKKHDQTGFLFEVGDERAESKTSQALREGLDVRAGNKKNQENNADSPTKKRERPTQEQDDLVPHQTTKLKKEHTSDTNTDIESITKDVNNAQEQQETKQPNLYPKTWSAV